MAKLIEFNGPANIVMLLDFCKMMGTKPDLQDIRQQAVLTMDFMQALNTRPDLWWHDFLMEEVKCHGCPDTIPRDSVHGLCPVCHEFGPDK